VRLIFVRQPELSTAGAHGKLLLAIYSYFAEAEREFISVRTKQGMAAARARGKQLGRPKGSRDKERALDSYREQIKEYLQLNMPLRRIRSMINPQLPKPLSYPAYRYFVRHDDELLALWRLDHGDAEDGFGNPVWWRGMPDAYQRQPLGKQRTNLSSHPRDGISWYQSVAFARWLNHRLQGLALPHPSGNGVLRWLPVGLGANLQVHGLT
jgi:hypothetical protein